MFSNLNPCSSVTTGWAIILIFPSFLLSNAKIVHFAPILCYDFRMIETERLILRKFTLEDLDAFAVLMADPEVMRFSLSGPMKNRKHVKEYLQKRVLDHYLQYGYGIYAVIQKVDPLPIGYAGLIRQNIEGENKTELGYRLLPKHWGKWLATEACLAICQYAFTQLGLNELISIIEAENTRSINVAKRIGMTYFKEASFHNTPVQIYRKN